MTDSAEFVHLPDPSGNIQTDILTKLNELRQQFPERFPKPIHVLAAVDATVDGQWEQRLQQAKEDQSGERITLIPYNSGNFRWIGILLGFKAEEKLERAEFIDPVEQSHFTADKLQKQFAKVYPDVILRSRNLQKHGNQEQSASLILEDLLKAVLEAGVAQGKRSNIDSLPVENHNDHETSTLPFVNKQPNNRDEESSLPTTTPSQGNESNLYHLKLRQTNELARLKVQPASKLIEKIQRTKQRIEEYKEEERPEEAEREMKMLSELQELQSLVNEVSSLESIEHVSKNNSESKLRHLEKHLNNELIRLKIQDVSKLSEKIQRIEKRIEEYKEEERTEEAGREKEVLAELRKLQALANEVATLRTTSISKSDTEINVSVQEECLVTGERIGNMYKDFCSMPSCSEKSIIGLLFYVSLKLAGSTIILDRSITISNPIETEIEKEFKCLKERLKIEELECSEIQHLVAEGLMNVKSENWKSALLVLTKLLKQINPLNIQELLRLVEKVDNAAHLIKNKAIILFLGGTGSGKSTTIHFLSGSKMVEQTVAGLNHIAPTEIKNSQLESITTSPFTQSETRYITPVTVNFKDVGAYSKGSIILCDSPGFDDTSGPEVDIANGIGIVKAIKGCKSVKPVVLVSYKGIGDRCDGIKDLAYVLVRLIPGIKDHIKAFSYIFTKFPDKERKTIHALLDDMNNKLNESEKSESSFVTFLKDMLHKTKDGAQVISPINDKPGDILDTLAGSSVISRPEDVFRSSITEKSKAIIKDQVQKNQLRIRSATKRSEYLFVKYKLDQLKCLNDLLDQTIAQSYNECVQFITKHLSEEYGECISTLNRCLIKQTILTNEDVERYQTCIDHCKLAEELRDTHLGKEVVDSSAFIQHLNQQVNIMCVDLREKDIDDLSIKISLDKIKLISKSFPDVDGEYKKICQFFLEKLALVAGSFKSSVLAKEFDESASNITKVHEALVIFQDHLNPEHMQSKYIELKKYFLKYLDDSVGEFDRIFEQEKLEESDINSLNSCVCMLETIINTFSLQPHVPKEAINEVYVNFLSKIVNYFQQIVKKIDLQFENKNAFHILEKFLSELHSIRKIPSIALKTAESYFSTLGKLVGYINESKRDAEELLNALFRRGGDVNYEKLTKCLSSLKSAKWIEQYQEGIYSDIINNVDEQIIQHIKELKESIMEINLGLDDFDKVEQIYKFVHIANKMKVVEEVVSGIVPYVDEINSWFEEKTKNVFFLIKNTFSLEKWKEQGYQNLDFNKLEKALNYLDACKKIRMLSRSECMPVLNDLEEFIRCFNNFVEKEMANCFDTIKQYENKDKEEIFEKARILLSRLLEISEIKTKYPRIFSCIVNEKHRELIEVWQSELNNYLIELSDEMGKLSITQRTERLSTKLLVAKALSKLDRFLDGEKYIDVYYKYQSIFFSQTNDVCKQIIEAIKNTDYERVSFEMTALESSNDVGKHFFKQAKRALNVGLDNLMEETKSQAIMLGNNIEIEAIKLIVENLKRMQRAKQFVSQFLDTSEEIESCIAEVKQLIEQRIKRFLEGVEALITINNFYEADKKIESITLARTLLGIYCTEDVFKQIEALKERQNDVVLKDVVNKYSMMDISGYNLNPPTDIFEKFKEVDNTNPIYNQALNTIKKNIFDKLRGELGAAKSKMPPNLENIHIRNFESGVKYLPENMRSALEVELRHCKDDINRLIQDNDNKLKNAFSSGDIKSIKSPKVCSLMLSKVENLF